MGRRVLCGAVIALLAAVPGALRAQIHFTANLNGAQEGLTTTGTGTGSFDLSEDFTQLRYVISYQGMTDTLTGGHFHTGFPGVAGPVVKPITGSGRASASTIAGTWSSTDATNPLTPALVDSLLEGKIYVNLHTPLHPGGEIRGQLQLATALHFEASLSSAQETPPNAATGGGTAVVVLGTRLEQIDYWVTYRGLSDSATGGHFHTDPPGAGGPVAKTLLSSHAWKSGTLSGSWKMTDATQPLTAALVDSLITGDMYVNFHTKNNPGGEIRGQLVLKGGTGFVASLSGANEVPPNAYPGTGTGSFVLNAARTQVTYNVTYIGLSDTITGGHIHAGAPGTNGPVVKPIGTVGDSSEWTDTGTWNTTDLTNRLTPALVDSMLIGSTYVNFHTHNNPGGEIRGWLHMTTGVGFTARLNGTQESLTDTSHGLGTGSFAISPARDTVSYSITYYGLTGATTAGHFHADPPGIAGGVVRNITGAAGSAATFDSVWTASDGSQPLTQALADSLFVGDLYVNFHTHNYPGGEIRGQLLYGSDVVTSVAPAPGGSMPVSFRLDQNYPNPFNPSTVIGFQIAKPSRVSLTVYNILGERVATLVDATKPAGAYTVTFDASRLSSGVYFYRLLADGAPLATRKMLLIR